MHDHIYAIWESLDIGLIFDATNTLYALCQSDADLKACIERIDPQRRKRMAVERWCILPSTLEMGDW